MDNEFDIVCYNMRGFFSLVKMTKYSPSVFKAIQACVVFGSGQIDSQDHQIIKSGILNAAVCMLKESYRFSVPQLIKSVKKSQ